MNAQGQAPEPDPLSRFTFLKDERLSDDLKKFLVEKSMEAGNAVWTRQLELKKWRWSTPLAVALAGAITIAMNFGFDYWRARQAQELKESASNSDALRRAESATREFEFRIVDRELSQNKSESERAGVLLFLVRAGVLKDLNVDALKDMAEKSLRDNNIDPGSIGVPSLGYMPTNSSNFVGKRFTSDDFRVFVANVDFSAWKPKFVVVGNSSVPTIADWHKISSDVRIKDLISYFRDHMGWRSGPHLVIDDEATWIFSDLARPGVYAPSWNDSAISIMMVGDYETEPFHPRVRENTVRAIATIDTVLKLAPSDLYLRREDPKSHINSPGKNVDKSDLIADVSKVLGTTAER